MAITFSLMTAIFMAVRGSGRKKFPRSISTKIRNNPEQQWHDTVELHAKQAGWLIHYVPDMMWRRAFVNKTPMKLGHRGFPDIVAARDGELMFIELKAKGGRLSPHQKIWRDVILSAELEWHCWYPDDIDEVIARFWGDRLREGL